MAAPSFPSVKSAASRSPARSFGSSSLRADYLNPRANARPEGGVHEIHAQTRSLARHGRTGGARRCVAGVAPGEAHGPGRLHPLRLLRGAVHHGRPAPSGGRHRRANGPPGRRARDPLSGGDRPAPCGRRRHGRGRFQRRGVGAAAVEWMLDQALKKDGLTLRDVQIKIMSFPDMVPALESGAVEAAILTEPFPTLAEERGIAVRPLPRPAGAKATPITTIFWNKDWAAKEPDLAHKVMVAYVKAARDLALDSGWKQERNIDLMVKYTGAKADVIRRARAHVLDPNLDMDSTVLDSMQRLASELGHLKYKDLLPVNRLFNFAYRDRAVAELGKKSS